MRFATIRVFIAFACAVGCWASSVTVAQPSELPVRVRMLSSEVRLDDPRGPTTFLIVNLGPDTLYYDPCAGGVYLDELDVWFPRVFAIGNMDACIQREPLAPRATVKIPTSLSFNIESMRETGLAPRYQLRLVDYFFRRLPPEILQEVRKFEDYVRIESVAVSTPFRFYDSSR